MPVFRVGEAFSVLSDESKRHAYDNGTTEYDDSAGRHHSSFFDERPFTFQTANDIFRQFFQDVHAMHHGHSASMFDNDPFFAGFGGPMGFGASPFGMLGGGMFGGFGSMPAAHQRASHRHAQSMNAISTMGGFMDPFGMLQQHSALMGGGFGGFGGGSSTSTSMSTTYDQFGRKVVKTTTTTTQNGQSSTTTKLQIHNRDGTVEEHVEESGANRYLNSDSSGQQSRSLMPGHSSHHSMHNFSHNAAHQVAHAAHTGHQRGQSIPIRFHQPQHDTIDLSDEDDEMNAEEIAVLGMKAAPSSRRTQSQSHSSNDIYTQPQQQPQPTHSRNATHDPVMQAHALRSQPTAIYGNSTHHSHSTTQPHHSHTRSSHHAPLGPAATRSAHDTAALLERSRQILESARESSRAEHVNAARHTRTNTSIPSVAGQAARHQYSQSTAFPNTSRFASHM